MKTKKQTTEQPTTEQQTTAETKQNTNTFGSSLKEFSLNYRLIVNGVPVGDIKNIKLKAENIRDAREQARKLLINPIRFE